MLAQEPAQEFIASYKRLIEMVEDGYLREGKRFVTIAVGCTGGKHRSVAIAQELARQLESDGTPVRVVHRDLGRE